MNSGARRNDLTRRSGAGRGGGSGSAGGGWAAGVGDLFLGRGGEFQPEEPGLVELAVGDHVGEHFEGIRRIADEQFFPVPGDEAGLGGVGEHSRILLWFGTGMDRHRLGPGAEWGACRAELDVGIEWWRIEVDPALPRGEPGEGAFRSNAGGEGTGLARVGLPAGAGPEPPLVGLVEQLGGDLGDDQPAGFFPATAGRAKDLDSVVGAEEFEAPEGFVVGGEFAAGEGDLPGAPLGGVLERVFDHEERLIVEGPIEGGDGAGGGEAGGEQKEPVVFDETVPDPEIAGLVVRFEEGSGLALGVAMEEEFDLGLGTEPPLAGEGVVDHADVLSASLADGSHEGVAEDPEPRLIGEGDGVDGIGPEPASLAGEQAFDLRGGADRLGPQRGGGRFRGWRLAPRQEQREPEERSQHERLGCG